MKIKMHARDILTLSPGEVYVMPDSIAKLLIRRGKATEVVEKKVKKE